MGVKSATERLRALLDERGVEWEDMSIRPYACTSWRDPDGEPCTALEGADDIPDGKLSAQALLTPEQAIAATLGSCDCSNSERTSDVDATGERQRVAGKVYLVEACDELIEGWCPLVAYLSREAAGRHAESLRGEVDGVMSFARVVEMKVVTDG